jgi:CBS domain-containing protein
MIKNVLTVTPDTTVAQALEIFDINDIRSVPVVDETGKLVGLFGFRHVLLALLPKSATMEDGLQRLDFVIGAAPGIAKRLKKLKPMKVADIMDKNPMVLHKDTATWEALRVMALHGSPISIVDEKDGKFVGMISRQTLLAELHRLLEEMEKDGEEDDDAA